MDEVEGGYSGPDDEGDDSIDVIGGPSNDRDRRSKVKRHRPLEFEQNDADELVGVRNQVGFRVNTSRPLTTMVTSEVESRSFGPRKAVQPVLATDKHLPDFAKGRPIGLGHQKLPVNGKRGYQAM
jgi:hypothetical protein